MKKKDKLKEENSDELLVETAQDYEEKCLKELNALKLAERKSSAQFEKSLKTNPVSENVTKFRNFDYVLDKKLILLVNEPNTSNWHLPQIEWTQNDISLRSVSFV